MRFSALPSYGYGGRRGVQQGFLRGIDSDRLRYADKISGTFPENRAMGLVLNVFHDMGGGGLWATKAHTPSATYSSLDLLQVKWCRS